MHWCHLEDMFLQCEGFEALPLAPSVRNAATEAWVFQLWGMPARMYASSENRVQALKSARLPNVLFAFLMVRISEESRVVLFLSFSALYMRATRGRASGPQCRLEQVQWANDSIGFSCNHTSAWQAVPPKRSGSGQGSCWAHAQFELTCPAADAVRCRHGDQHHHVVCFTADGRVVDTCVHEPVQ